MKEPTSQFRTKKSHSCWNCESGFFFTTKLQRLRRYLGSFEWFSGCGLGLLFFGAAGGLLEVCGLGALLLVEVFAGLLVEVAGLLVEVAGLLVDAAGLLVELAVLGLLEFTVLDFVAVAGRSVLAAALVA